MSRRGITKSGRHILDSPIELHSWQTRQCRPPQYGQSVARIPSAAPHLLHLALPRGPTSTDGTTRAISERHRQCKASTAGRPGGHPPGPTMLPASCAKRILPPSREARDFRSSRDAMAVRDGAIQGATAAAADIADDVAGDVAAVQRPAGIAPCCKRSLISFVSAR